MITYDHDTLRLFGIPVFTIVISLLLLTAVTLFLWGVTHWKKTAGKIAAVAAGLVLLAMILAVLAMLLTVASGSMG